MTIEDLQFLTQKLNPFIVCTGISLQVVYLLKLSTYIYTDYFLSFQFERYFGQQWQPIKSCMISVRLSEKHGNLQGKI